MERKKVERQITSNETPKRREEVTDKNSPITFVPNDTKIKWEKVKGINGKIVRYKQGEDLKRREELSKKTYKKLYVGIDGNDIYFYYEVFD